MSADPLLPVEEAAQRLNVSVETVLRYARRNKWRKLKGNDGVLVAVPPDMLRRPEKSLQEPPPPAPATSSASPAIAAALQAALGPLQAMLDRETQDRRTLQRQSDALRDQLHATQLDAAKAHGDARMEAARREAAEARARDLQAQLDAIRSKPRRWWPF
jgi:septal ring factor EnvC (AmiA/AmiB activator)